MWLARFVAASAAGTFQVSHKCHGSFQFSMREFCMARARLIRMIATDIDGTLLDSQQRLPDRNRDALTAAHEAGIHIVLVTGRRFPFALPIVELLPFDHVLITCNGAVIRSRQGVTHMRTLLPRATAAAV